MNNCDNSYHSMDDSELASLVKNGDDSAFDMLAVRYLRLIGFIARKFSAESYEHNDFIQEGLLALLSACKTYSKDNTASFKSYLSVVVNHRFVSIIRKQNAQKSIPKSSLIQFDEISDSLIDESPNPEEQLLCREQLNSVIKELKKLLSLTEYNVMMLYLNGASYQKISETLNISTKACDNAISRAKAKIRKICPE